MGRLRRLLISSPCQDTAALSAKFRPQILANLKTIQNLPLGSVSLLKDLLDLFQHCVTQ
jgi:hypothetical protein